MPKDGSQTLSHILEGGLAVASVHGLGGITIGALASELGMSKSGLYGHFKSKEKLQLAILQNAIDRFVEGVIAPALKAPRGEPRVRALFESWLSWAHATDLPGGCPFVTAAVEFDDQPGAIRDFVAKSQRDWLDTLAHAVKIGIGEAHFDPAVDPDQVAFEIYSTAYGYHFVSRLLKDPVCEMRARQSFERILENAGAGGKSHG
jgi:AcrR family transcriptional regulator